MTTTSPGLMRWSRTAAKHAFSESKTRAGPLNCRVSWPASLMTQPSGASVPRRIASPPVALIGCSIGRMTSWPGVSRVVAAISRDRLPGHGRRRAVHEPGLQQLAHDEPDAAGLGDVGCAVAAARSQVADERRARGDLIECVDVERDARTPTRSRAGAARRSWSRRSPRCPRSRCRATRGTRGCVAGRRGARGP